MLTVLTSGQRLATKVLRGRPDGVEVVPFGDVMRWRWRTERLSGLADLEAALVRLAREPRSCVIGEAVKPGREGREIRRSFDYDIERRDRRWLALDCDGWMPPGWPLDRPASEADIRAAVAALRATLPGLEGAECLYRLSSSSGLRKVAGGLRVPGWAELRCHLWFWLDRPVAPDGVKPWLARVNAAVGPGPDGARVWDPGMLDGARVHYTADPVCEGVADPVRGVARLGRLPGRPAVAPAEWVTGSELAARAAAAAADGWARLEASSRARRDAGGAGHSAGWVAESLRRMSAERVRENVAKIGETRSGGGPRVFTCSMLALTHAQALEWHGEAGAVAWACQLLSAAGVAAKTIRDAEATVDPLKVQEQVEMARRRVKPPEPQGMRPARPVEQARPGRVASGHYGAAAVSVEQVWMGPAEVWPVELVRAVGGTDRETGALDAGARYLGPETLAALRALPVPELAARELVRPVGGKMEGLPFLAAAAEGAQVLAVPLYGVQGGRVGWAAVAADGREWHYGRRWPVGLRRPVEVALALELPARPVVLVRDMLDALALAGEAAAVGLDVVAVGNEWRSDWNKVLRGRPAVVLAPVPGVNSGPVWEQAGRAAAGVGVGVIQAGWWERAGGARSWREVPADMAVGAWQRAVEEVRGGCER